MAKTAERSGKPDFAELVRQGRIKYNSSRGLDPNPNPTVGNVPNPDSGMRAGLTPEKYHKMVLLSERRRKLNKEWDFVPMLEDHEWDIYLAWLKKGGPKNMRASGAERGRAQQQDVMALIRKYDPSAAAELAAVPTHALAQVRDAIGDNSFSEELEEVAADAEPTEVVEDVVLEEAPEGEEEAADVAPEAKVASPDEAPGYESIDADEDVGEPEVVSAPKKRRGPNKKK